MKIHIIQVDTEICEHFMAFSICKNDKVWTARARAIGLILYIYVSYTIKMRGIETQESWYVTLAINS